MRLCRRHGLRGADTILEANKVAYFNAYVDRTEFVNTYSGMSDPQYVNTLISNTGVAFTQEERDTLLAGLLNHTETRATVLRKITEKSSFRAAEYNSMFVLMEYFGYLRRNAEPSGFTFLGEQAQHLQRRLSRRRNGEGLYQFRRVPPPVRAVTSDREHLTNRSSLE